MISNFPKNFSIMEDQRKFNCPLLDDEKRARVSSCSITPLNYVQTENFSQFKAPIFQK